jgi:hypothetical protein
MRFEAFSEIGGELRLPIEHGTWVWSVALEKDEGPVGLRLMSHPDEDPLGAEVDVPLDADVAVEIGQALIRYGQRAQAFNDLSAEEQVPSEAQKRWVRKMEERVLRRRQGVQNEEV